MTAAVQPLVLVANGDKWLTESLESVLTQGGYQVVATARRQQVLEHARSQRPDGILLDLGLDRRTSDSFALCRALRADPSVSRATPIVLLTAGPAQAFQRAGRISDALGRTAPAEFVVFAPATDEMGAHGLVQRVTDTVARTMGGAGGTIKLRAGISAAPAPSAPAQLSPPELLEDARNALR